jgi:ParB family chromosome partitioning protein
MSILGVGVNAIESSSLLFNNDELLVKSLEYIQLIQIIIGNYQPRKNGKITQDSIQGLVESIKEQGVLQPIIVRKTNNPHYELIAGERRYLSALEAGLIEIPCVIKAVSEADAFSIAIIENIQRDQLTLLEEAEAYLKLKETYLLTVEKVSKIIGRPRTTVANLIRVASLLSQKGKEFLEEKRVDFGHIRAIISLNQFNQDMMLEYIVEQKLSVRVTEKIIRDKKYHELINNTGQKIKNTALNKEEIKNISSKFHAMYNKNVKIKTIKGDKIRLSMEFDNLSNLYDYLQDSS